MSSIRRIPYRDQHGIRNLESRGKVSRRNLIKLVASGAGALAFSRFLPLTPAEACTGKYPGTMWLGTHDLQHVLKGTQDFYIFKTLYCPSAGVTAEPSGYFDLTAANNAGQAKTALYVDLAGADLRGSYTPTQWGDKQANDMYTEWVSGTWESYTTSGIMFATIIPTKTTNGWGTSTSSNQTVLDAYLNTMVSNGFTAGIYSSDADWSAAFGSASWLPSQDFTFWASPHCWTACNNTGGNTVFNIACSPCDTTCSATKCELEVIIPNVLNNAIGGESAVMWNYWPACSPCGGSSPGVTGLHDCSIANPASSFPNTTYSGGSRVCGTGCYPPDYSSCK